SGEWQQQWGERTTSSVNLMSRHQRHGLVYENISATPAIQALQLNNSRRDTYRSIGVSLRHAFESGEEVMVDYTYSRARSNKIFDYSLEDFLLTGQAAGPLLWDAPHRVISRGGRQTNLWQLFFSYFAEYRSGYPFSVDNSAYQLVGTP